MTIGQDGCVGIGTTSPAVLLHVYGPSTRIRVDDYGSGDTGIINDMQGIELSSGGMNTSNKYGAAVKFMSTDGQLSPNPKLLAGIFPRATETYDDSIRGGMAMDFGTTPNTPGASSVPLKRMTIDQDGNVGIGVTSPLDKLHVSGNIRASSLANGSSADLEATAAGVIQRKSSDRRLKKNIKTIKGALEKVSKLRGVTFDWKDAEKMGPSDYGLIGQEVEKIVPELVSEDSKGYRSVKYTNTVAILIEAIKEQQAQITALEKKLQKLDGKKSK